MGSFRRSFQAFSLVGPLSSISMTRLVLLIKEEEKIVLGALLSGFSTGLGF